MKKIIPDNGFTLVEVLMALVVLMFGILAIASMQIMAMKGNTKAREATEGSTMGQFYVEQLLSYSLDHNNLRAGSHFQRRESDDTVTLSPTDDIQFTKVPNQPLEEIAWTVENVDDVDGDGNFDEENDTHIDDNIIDDVEATVKKITVQIKLRDSSGVLRTTTLTTQKNSIQF